MTLAQGIARDVTFQALKESIEVWAKENCIIFVLWNIYTYYISNTKCWMKIVLENWKMKIRIFWREYEFCKIKEFNLKRSWIFYKLCKKRMNRRSVKEVSKER